MDSYEQLQADVFYLAGHKQDYDAAWTRIEAFAAEAKGVNAGRAAWLRGGVLREQGRLEEAMAVFQAAAAELSADPGMQLSCLLDCAILANWNGDLAAAEAAEQELLQLARREPEAQNFLELVYGNIGDTHYLRGDIIGAIEWYKKAIRRLEDPLSAKMPAIQRLCLAATGWHGLARCYLALGDLVRVRFAIEGVRQCPHPDLQGLGALDEFQVCLRTGALAQAERWLAEAEGKIRDRTRSQYLLLGRVWLAQARGDEAAAQQYRDRLHSEHERVIYDVHLQLETTQVQEGIH